MVKQNGEISWNDDEYSKKSDKSSKELWLRLAEGDNQMRIITTPHKYLAHKGVKKEGDRGYGQKVNCSASHPDSNGKCPLCEAGLKASQRYLIGVIDKATKMFKILDVSYGVFNDIKKLNKNPVWGDPSKYDIILNKNSAAPPADFYSVQPIPHSPLSATEQAVRDAAAPEIEDLKRKVLAPSYETVQKRLEKILDDGASLFIPPNQKKDDVKGKGTNTAKSSPKVDISAAQEEIDDVFPPYDAQ